VTFGLLDVVNIAHPVCIVLGAHAAYPPRTAFGLGPIATGLLIMPLCFLPAGPFEGIRRRPAHRSPRPANAAGDRQPGDHAYPRGGHASQNVEGMILPSVGCGDSDVPLRGVGKQLVLQC
jgi:hypothetical protein